MEGKDACNHTVTTCKPCPAAEVPKCDDECYELSPIERPVAGECRKPRVRSRGGHRKREEWGESSMNDGCDDDGMLVWCHSNSSLEIMMDSKSKGLFW